MTSKQSLALSKLQENHGNVSKSMREAGYTDVTAKNPKNLTNSKAYKELYAPLLKQHQVTIKQYIKNIGDAMTANKTIVMGKDSTEGFVDIIPDHMTRLAGNRQAERFLFKDKTSATAEPLSEEDMRMLLDEADEVKLSQAVFRLKDKN